MVLNLFHVQHMLHFENKIFQPLNAFRHGKELLDIVRANYSEDCVSPKEPTIFLYGNGSSDHQTTCKSVQLSTIYTFMALKLDVYITTPIASNQSFCNPVERVMSTQNLGLENVVTERRSVRVQEPLRRLRKLRKETSP